MLGANKKETSILELVFPFDNSRSSFATEQFFNLFHLLLGKLTFWQKLLRRKNIFSLEVVSTKSDGIRFLLVLENKFKETIKRSLLSYSPGIEIREIKDYVEDQKQEIVELKLSNHFAYNLTEQKILTENDPMTYLTGSMTKLLGSDVVAFQIVITPVTSIYFGVLSEVRRIQGLISQEQSLKNGLNKNFFEKLLLLPFIGWLFLPLKVVEFIIMFGLSMIIGVFDTSGKSVPWLMRDDSKNIEPNDLYELELKDKVKKKFSQPLFETSIRLLVSSKDSAERINGLMSALGQFNNQDQSLKKKRFVVKKNFKQRKLSLLSNSILSVSELSDLYHFPLEVTTRTEDLIKLHSKRLASPLSMKNSLSLEVIFGKNNYGDKEVTVGLTGEDRSRHVYVLGQTGSGKSTVMFHMAKDDICAGRGLAILDPHGDLSMDLLNVIPKDRIDDCVYFNPADLAYPIGLNLMEIKEGLTGDDLEQEKELVAEGLISVFRRIFNKDENNDSHRIEYILRNTIYTAFTLPSPTIFTIYELLTNPKFQKRVTRELTDENLKRFWKNEFGKAGSYQVIKMVSGVTAKIGRFLFSPTAKRILEQQKSTIDFEEILDKQKILICNLAEGRIGEDTSQLLGTMIITKIQQAAVRRVRTNRKMRLPFYLFIDEFQNFATSSFIKLLSGGRKFGLRLTIAEQSTCQQEDKNIVNVILANCGTVICFRTASPVDEELMLTQFSPNVTASDISNLPRYRFLMKLAAVSPEEPMSGETLPIVYEEDKEKMDLIISMSRVNYASKYQQKRLIKKTNEVNKKSNRDIGSLT